MSPFFFLLSGFAEYFDDFFTAFFGDGTQANLPLETAFKAEDFADVASLSDWTFDNRSDLPVGTYTYKVVAYDGNGNEGEASIDITVKERDDVSTDDGNTNNTGDTSSDNTNSGEDTSAGGDNTTGDTTETITIESKSSDGSGGSTQPLFIVLMALLVWRRYQR